MAYTSGGLREFRMASAATLDTGSNHGTFEPAYQPVVIRAVAAIVTTALGSNDITATFTKRDSVTGSSLATVDTLTFTSGMVVGNVLYVDGLNVTLTPGQDVVVASSGNADGAASFYVVYEQAPEVPGNNTNMTESA